jgi:hypothetical protein
MRRYLEINIVENCQGAVGMLLGFYFFGFVYLRQNGTNVPGTNKIGTNKIIKKPGNPVNKSRLPDF